MADRPVKMNEKQNNDVWYIYRVDITFITQYFAPALSPNKYVKKHQIADIMKCYSEEAHEIVEHLDRAFYRDNECNIMIPGHVFSASLREVLENNNIVVRGSVTVPKEYVRIGTAKAGSSLLVYEYIPPGVTVSSVFKINMPIPKKTVIIFAGARKYKGFGKIKINFEEAKTNHLKQEAEEEIKAVQQGKKMPEVKR